ncbi:MAG: DsbA family protein [Planktomarina sp.]
MNIKMIAIAAVVAIIGVGGYFLTVPEDEVDTSFAVVDMALGEADAPVTIIEYASYTCPHCRRFHEGTFQELKRDYVDTGKVRFIYREVFFDRYGLWGAIVARCDGEEKFFAISDMLYKQQQTWAQGTPEEIASNLRRIGLSAGLSAEAVDACFEDADNASELVAWYEANAKQDGISSTPSFVINGTTYSNMSYDDFKGVIDPLL